MQPNANAMHGFAGTAVIWAATVGLWPVTALLLAHEVAFRVRWRLLWSTNPDWSYQFRSDARQLLALWRADVRRLLGTT